MKRANSYEELYNNFTWDIPEHYNMGVDVCDKWADQEPDKIAIIELTNGTRNDVSFGELKILSDNLASHLHSIGIKKGDRIGVLRSQSVWTAAAHIAIWKLGAISVPLFILFREEALLTRLENCGAKAIIVDEVSIKLAEPLQEKLPNLNHIIVPEHIDFNTKIDFEIVDTKAEDPAILIYTSGTTGAPKGALHAHRVLLGHLPGVELSHDFLPQKGDVIWTPADWAWIGGLFDVLMPALHHGVPVLAARLPKFNSKACKEIIETAGIKNVFFPPTALKMLKAENVKIEGLRSVASGGEPLGAELLEWGKKNLGVSINEFYGQTECNMIVTSCANLFETRAGYTGRIVPGHSVSVIDDNGDITDQEGDIAVRRGTPVMMLKYWKNEEATAEIFFGDWMLTGDRGIIEEGYIRFIGRDDDVITSAGYRIGPTSIENCLMGHEAVKMAAVIGKPDAQRTEIVKAYVVLNEGVQQTENLVRGLQKHVKEKLAAHEYPREVEFVTELPMTVTGKIIRKELKARAIAELEGR
ncbi:MAG: AMP-binding protein [Rhizobiales bacterium]|nr:AMP-binding protein [Hyphomicrobiales bacterium]